MIKKCECENKYQDNKYGHKMRVQNETKISGSGSKNKTRCSVCCKIND